MNYFENITQYQTMEEWRNAYLKHSGGQSMPADVPVEIAKIRKKHGFTFPQLAAIIAECGGLAGASARIEQLTNDGSLFKVMVDDNYHFMDEDERYITGAYAKYDEAVKVAKEIVDRSFQGPFPQGTTAKELYDSYTNFGEDPFISPGVPPAGEVEFSAWDYAKARSEQVLNGAK